MYTTIAGVTLQSYRLYVSLAVALSISIAFYRLRGGVRWRALADAGLAILAGGLVLARLEYVLMNGDIFGGDLAAMAGTQVGGLGWHGAVIGALIGLWGAARAHGLPAVQLLEASAPALPLVAFAGWTACRAVGCAYGAEVETLAYYPAWLVTEERDIYGIIAPRYDTVTFGQTLSWGLLVWIGARWWRGISVKPGVLLMVFCVGMLAIGAVRGDVMPVWFGIRAGQWLTGLLVLVLLAGMGVRRWRAR